MGIVTPQKITTKFYQIVTFLHLHSLKTILVSPLVKQLLLWELILLVGLNLETLVSKTFVREISEIVWLLRRDQLFNLLLLLKVRLSSKKNLKKFTYLCFDLLARVSNKSFSSFAMSMIAVMKIYQRLLHQRNLKSYKSHKFLDRLFQHALSTVLHHHQEKELARARERVACADCFKTVTNLSACF